jgi:hypothetical protein
VRFVQARPAKPLLDRSEPTGKLSVHNPKTVTTKNFLIEFSTIALLVSSPGVMNVLIAVPTAKGEQRT